MAKILTLLPVMPFLLELQLLPPLVLLSNSGVERPVPPTYTVVGAIGSMASVYAVNATGNPLFIAFHVTPPLVLLNTPYSPAYTVAGVSGSIARAEPQWFMRLVAVQLLPPLVLLKTPPCVPA